jgi:hypothetical protein
MLHIDAKMGWFMSDAPKGLVLEVGLSFTK